MLEGFAGPDLEIVVNGIQISLVGYNPIKTKDVTDAFGDDFVPEAGSLAASGDSRFNLC